MSNIDNSKEIGCPDHSFSLTPLLPNCFFSKNITASFCENPIPRTTGTVCPVIKSRKKQWRCLNCPSFNKDGSYASPGFILTSEQNYYQQSYHRIMMEHQKNMKEYQHEKSQLCVAKPKSKSKYCSVCKNVYQQYLDHIKSDEHRKQIKLSKFNKYIQEIQSIMKHKQPQNHPKTQNQKTQLEPSLQKIESITTKLGSLSSEDDNELYVNSIPRKKVKKEQSINFIQMVPSAIPLSPFSICFSTIPFNNCQFINYFNPSNWIYNNYCHFLPGTFTNFNQQIPLISQPSFFVIPKQQ